MVYVHHDPLYGIQERNWQTNYINKRTSKSDKQKSANINVIYKVIRDTMPYWVNLGYQKFIVFDTSDNYSHFFAELQNLVIPVCSENCGCILLFVNSSFSSNTNDFFYYSAMDISPSCTDLWNNKNSNKKTLLFRYRAFVLVGIAI